MSGPFLALFTYLEVFLRESVLVALIKVLECADKRCILPKQKNPFPKWQDVLSKR